MVKKRGLGVYIIFVGGKIIQKLCRSQPGHTTTFSARTILKKLKFSSSYQKTHRVVLSLLSLIWWSSRCARTLCLPTPATIFCARIGCVKSSLSLYCFFAKTCFFVNFFVSFTLTATSRLRLVLWRVWKLDSFDPLSILLPQRKMKKLFTISFFWWLESGSCAIFENNFFHESRLMVMQQFWNIPVVQC